MKRSALLALLSLIFLQAGILYAMEGQTGFDSDALNNQLILAVQEKKIDKIKELIDAGVSPITREDKTYGTPLHIAAAQAGGESVSSTLRALIVHVPQEKLQHIIPVLIVFKRQGEFQLPRDLRKIMANQLVKDVVDEQVTRAQQLLLMKNLKGKTARQVAQERANIEIDMGFPNKQETLDVLEILASFMQNKHVLRAEIEEDVRKRIFTLVNPEIKDL